MCPNVAVVILNWNGRDDTLECLESVRGIDYPNFEVIVVDNGSSDDSVQAIRERFPALTVIETGKNLGYAGGNNVGIRTALERGAEYVLLLNNDTVVSKSLLSELIAVAELSKGGGILGAKIYYYSDRNRIWYAGAKWSDKLLGFDLCGMGEEDRGQFEEIAETDYVCGCALLAKREVFEAVGLLDEKFFLTYEESDFCYRARRAGYKSYLVPQAKVWHKVSASFGGQQTPLYSYFMTRNMFLWARRHRPLRSRWRAHWETYRRIVPTFPTKALGRATNARQLYWGVREYRQAWVRMIADPLLTAKRRAILDYWMRRFGDCPRKVRAVGTLDDSQRTAQEV